MPTTLTLLPLPANLQAWCLTDIERLRDALTSRTYTVDGVLIWNTNDRPVPPHVFEGAFVQEPEGQEAAHAANQSAAIAEYIAARKGKPVSAEERYEARAAHGPGVELVDVLTGDRFTT